jgi:DNA replication and repair protein RecF
VEHGYLQALRGYLHALRQRNAALKSVAAGELTLAGLEPWTEEMARLGEAVSTYREAYLRDLVPVVREVMAELAPDVAVDVHFRRGWQPGQPLRKVLGDSVPREVKLASSQSGPHRADVELRVSGLHAGATLSRGQGKALASALMLAQARLLGQTARRSSVFLIDDIGAELDLPHSERFFRLLVDLGAQILATSNSGPGTLAGLPEVETVMFHVEHGRVHRINEA